MNIWDVLFRSDRGKNAQTLLDLEMTYIQAKKVLKELKVEDYSEGPLEDRLNQGPEMWVFGKNLKNREIYIKITMGVPGTSVICISFHFSERPLSYPYKQ